MIRHQQLMTQEQWIAYGVERGYCTETYCAAHEGPEYDPEEVDAWDSGEDPCIHAVRVKYVGVEGRS